MNLVNLVNIVKRQGNKKMIDENFSDIASIRFGNVRFLIKQTPEVGEYFLSNLPEEEINKLMPSAQTWYTQILGLLSLSHEKEAEVETVIYSIVSDDSEEGNQKEIINNKDKVKEFKEFIESPLKIENKDKQGNKGNKGLKIKFALRIKNQKEEKENKNG